MSDPTNTPDEQSTADGQAEQGEQTMVPHELAPGQKSEDPVAGDASATEPPAAEPSTDDEVDVEDLP